MSDVVIISRHRGAVEFIARALGGSVGVRTERIGPKLCVYFTPYTTATVIPVLEDATPDDVRDKGVYGNIPLDLASHAACVHAIIYPPGKAPRGRDFGLAEMDAVGATLCTYVVNDVTDGLREAAESARRDSHA